MIWLVTIRELKTSNRVEIVWRNPKRVRTQRRRQIVERAGEKSRYALEEFVVVGELGYWSAISNLEVVAGGRAA